MDNDSAEVTSSGRSFHVGELTTPVILSNNSDNPGSITTNVGTKNHRIVST